MPETTLILSEIMASFFDIFFIYDLIDILQCPSRHAG